MKGGITLYRTISRKRDCDLLNLNMKSFGSLENRLGHSVGSDLVVWRGRVSTVKSYLYWHSEAINSVILWINEGQNNSSKR